MHSKDFIGPALWGLALIGLNAQVQAQAQVQVQVQEQAQAQVPARLSGDARLACEALLCLSTGAPPSECNGALDRYFSIAHRKLAHTIRLRGNFLRQCPAAYQTAQMADLVAAQAQGAGRCDAAALNASQRQSGGADQGAARIGNRMPGYCAAYTSHAYTDWSDTLPRYVGVPERGGHWVPAQQHARAERAYQARVQSENAARRQAQGD